MTKKPTNSERVNQQGFSLIELLVVLTILTVMAGISIFYLTAHTKVLRVEDQALKLMDILQEAKQRALTQRRTMRVEINQTLNIVRLIDENVVDPNTLQHTAANDFEVRRMTIDAQPPNVPSSPQMVRVGIKPANVNFPSPPRSDLNPPEPTPVPDDTFTGSSHPMSPAHQVIVLRFKSNGRVFDAGGNDIGNGDVMEGRTIYVWQPDRINASDSTLTRAITVLGATGTIRLWDYNHQASPRWQARR